ncbi:unnamed protein product [Triticum turgidum subsp. durum]|uniref:GATA-type domain-containing protein n=1 Tax=Triticum turgidum subsp. durum TaxID=4567 RepID=A0A9R0ZGP8_TRITD|nr:unnamed protein product [Triticum turgidum subsp. durum]
MSTIYMSQLSTSFPLMEEDHHQDHHQGHFQAFTLPKDPPILFPFVISNSSPSDNSSLGYGSDQHLMQHHAMLDQPQHMIGGSSSVFSTPFPTVESIRDDMIERSYSYDPYDMEKLQATSGGSLKIGKWAAPAPAAKMRITRKTSDPGVKKPRKRAQAYEDHGHMGGMNQALGVIRTCSDCNTTKTPLWRSGPCGPKAAAEPPVVVPTTAPAAAPGSDLVDTIGANWSKSPTAAPAACFRPSPAPFAVPVPVQDEITDAAMLLMTLSCELVRS